MAVAGPRNSPDLESRPDRRDTRRPASEESPRGVATALVYGHPAAPLTAGLLIALQRTAGNRAAQDIIRSTTSSHGRSGLPVVMRDAGPQDAGVPLPAGIPPTAEELEAQRLNAIGPADLADEDIFAAYDAAVHAGAGARAAAIASVFQDRPTRDRQGWGVGLPSPIPRSSGGSALVTPDIALSMLENMVAGRPAFRPELGVGGSSWFVTQGNPYTGVGTGHTVPAQVDLINTRGGRIFGQSDLDAMFAQESARARPEVEAQVREQFRVRSGRPAPEALSRGLIDKIDRQLRGLAERRMWERVGREVAGSPAKVGEVVLPPGGPFSQNPGRFTVVADAAKIRIRGGPMALVDAVRTSGAASPVPALEVEAAALAQRLQTAGRVRSVFRVGGRILIVIAVAADVYRIITAEDKVEAIVTSAGGWAGATAASAAFAAWWTPADVAGPWAWAGHGVGTLLSGAIGYWVGSEVTRYVYRLVVVGDGTVRTGD